MLQSHHEYPRGAKQFCWHRFHINHQDASIGQSGALIFLVLILPNLFIKDRENVSNEVNLTFHACFIHIHHKFSILIYFPYMDNYNKNNEEKIILILSNVAKNILAMSPSFYNINDIPCISHCIWCVQTQIPYRCKGCLEASMLSLGQYEGC